MKIKFFKYSILFLGIFISLIIYFSVVGVETEKFNRQIKNKISGLNENLDLDLKKVKFNLDILNFKINAKTIGAIIRYSNKPLELEYIKAQVSLASIIKDKLVLSDLEITTKSLLLNNLVKFVRATNNRTELFILEKIIKRGYIILDLKLYFDENGNIDNNFHLTGILKDGKIGLSKNNNFDKINFLFSVQNNNFVFKKIGFIADKINFSSDALKVTKKKNSFFFEGTLENKKSILTSNLLRLIKIDLKNFDFKNASFRSKNNFSFEIDNRYKINNFILNTVANIDQIKYKKRDFISAYFPEVNEIILLKDHKLKLDYNKNKLSIKGEGKIKFEKDFNKIEYLINKKGDNYDFTTDLILKNINIKKQSFLKSYFPLITDKINLKDHKININYKNNNLLLSGFGKIKIEQEFDDINYFISRNNNKFNFDINLNINKTNFKIGNLNYKKKDKVITKLKIDGEFEEGQMLNLNNISILEGNNKIKINNLLLNKDNLIIKIAKADFDYVDSENKQNKFIIQNKGIDNYELSGIIFNANTLIANLLKSNDKNMSKIFENNISLSLNLDKVFIDEISFVKNFKGKLFIKDNKVNESNISAIFDNKQNISFTINTDNQGNKITTLYSSKAKPLVKRYSFIKGFDGGFLDFYSLKKNNISKSKLNIYDFKLKELPTLTKLLTLASLEGIADILSGDGIRFDEFEMNFKNENNLMTINEIYAIGPSISILMSGYVEQEKLVSLRGTLVPATTINKTISLIPLFGKILVGDKTGEGVFGVSFKIKGPPNNLETTVNPIKTLTPRFITRTLEKIKKN